MNKIQKGKAGLLSLGIILIITGIVCGIFAVICTTNGAVNNQWWLWIVAALLYVFALAGLIIGIVFTWTAASLKATKGSIAEDNLGIGTVNMIKCSNCGNQLNATDKCCGNCGKELNDTTTCPNCNAKTKKDNKHCTNCGQDL